MKKSPQLEDGYTMIANELLDQIYKIKMSGQEFQILLAIIRKTYGFKKKFDWISLTQLSEMTGISKVRVYEAKKSLLTRNIVTELKEGVTVYLGIQKNYSKWVNIRKNVTINKSKKIRKNVTTVTQKRNDRNAKAYFNTRKSVTTKDNNTKETITKETITKKRNKDAIEKLETRQKISLWILKRFSIKVTNQKELKDYFKIYGYAEFLKMIIRFDEYQKMFIKNNWDLRFRLSRRWNKFIENIDVFKSDEDFKTYMEMIQSRESNRTAKKQNFVIAENKKPHKMTESEKKEQIKKLKKMVSHWKKLCDKALKENGADNIIYKNYHGRYQSTLETLNKLKGES